jgi:putative ABC transport system ATP-binding protein
VSDPGAALRPASSEGGAPSVPAVQVRGLTKYYDSGLIRALNGVDLDIGHGEIVSITGPSGCGKSTLLHLLAALDVPTSGSIRVEGHDVGKLDHPNRYRREVVGLVFQLHNLLPRLSLLGNVEIAMMGSRRPRRERGRYALKLLEEVGLRSLAHRRPTQLSGGERQRVAIARAMANDPSVLLADEPTGSLDTASVRSVLSLFGKLRAERATTIVLVTHDPSVAKVADRRIEMLDGGVESDSQARLIRGAPGGSRSGDLSTT